MRTFTQRLLGIFGGLAGTLLAFGVLASSTQYKPYGVADIQRPQWDALQQEIKNAAAKSSNLQRGDAHPVAFAAQTEHDFGLLNPHTTAQHAFVIENRGAAPLRLVAADTSCKCTLSDVGSQWVAPGDSTEVTLVWNTGDRRAFYRQYAVIKTNDLRRPEIELGVRGTILAALAFDGDALTGLSSAPDEPVESSVMLYSQTTDDFEIVQVDCDLPQFTWSVEPCAADSLHEHQAKSGWRVRFSALPTAAAYTAVMRVRVEPARTSDDGTTAAADSTAAAAPLTVEVPLAGRVLPRVAFYGAGLYAGEGLDMGVLQQGAAHRFPLVVRVRGSHRPETMEVLDIQPAALTAAIEPLASSPGTYRLLITVPADAPAAVFNADVQHGYVKVGDARDDSVSGWFPIRGAIVAAAKR